MILHNQRGFEHTYSVCRNGGHMGFFDRFKKKKHQEEELNEQEAVLDENSGETSTLRSRLPKPKRRSR